MDSIVRGVKVRPELSRLNEHLNLSKGHCSGRKVICGQCCNGFSSEL